MPPRNARLRRGGTVSDPDRPASGPVGRHAWRSDGIALLVTGAASLWLIAFVGVSLSLPLPNNPNFDRLSPIFLSTLLASPHDLPTGWRFLPERFDLIGVALLIALGAWAWGRLSMRVIRIDGEDWLERLAISYGLGLSIWSLVTLFLGLAGLLDQRLFAGLLVLAILADGLISLWRARVSAASGGESGNTPDSARHQPSRWLIYACLGVVVLFIGRALLGAMLPPGDFDVREYHLGGPKEWFLDGHIHFLPHNVYTSFPFLTEMLSLSSMVVRGDWYRGALAGKLLLATFYPLTVLGVFVTGRRLFGARAGLLAMLVFATTPWAYRIATIAYAEGGLTCYIILALFALVRALSGDGHQSVRWILAAGLLAGSAMACKYTGVVQAVIPLGIGIVAGRGWQRGAPAFWKAVAWKPAVIAGAAYAAGVCLAVGPWLVKNLLETGNPVYPLMWSLFGGADWNAALNDKWQQAHRASEWTLDTLISGLTSIAITNDWQSLLVFAFVPLAVLAGRRKPAAGVALYLGWLLLAWWALTHRIDRFWVPLLPVACLLSGLGMTWAGNVLARRASDASAMALMAWRLVCGILVGGMIAFNLLFITSPLIGNPHVLYKLEAARKIVENPNMAILNRSLPSDAKVLIVGGADIFDARFPLVYNTVFDPSIFEQWTARPNTNHLKSPEQIRQTFADHGITHIFVNWREILRYRATYGYTAYVTPGKFESLVAEGILAEPITTGITPAEGLDDSWRRDARANFPSLFHGDDERRIIITGQLYRVLPVRRKMPPASP